MREASIHPYSLDTNRESSNVYTNAIYLLRPFIYIRITYIENGERHIIE